MVELFEQDEKQNKRRSSKGNQLKWENQGIWYKADYTGYEGLETDYTGEAVPEFIWRKFKQVGLLYKRLYGQSPFFGGTAEPYYSDEVKHRVREILVNQRRKYQYLFSG